MKNIWSGEKEKKVGGGGEKNNKCHIISRTIQILCLVNDKRLKGEIGKGLLLRGGKYNFHIYIRYIVYFQVREEDKPLFGAVESRYSMSRK